MTSARETMESVLAAHPDLSANGWKFREIGENQQASEARHAEARSRVLTDDTGHCGAEFERALEYLSRCMRRKTVWKGASSYSWKHHAEHYFSARDGGGGYISNGMFIAAAIALDFVIERIPNSPNCWLNISASERYTWRGDGKFLNHRSGKWIDVRRSLSR